MTVVFYALVLFGVLTTAEGTACSTKSPVTGVCGARHSRNLAGMSCCVPSTFFRSIPRLDRLEMTAEALNGHISGALDRRDAFGEELSDSIFLTCVLEYRVDQKPVSTYRAFLRE